MRGGAPLTLTRYHHVREALNDPRLVIHKPLAVGDEASHLATVTVGARSHRIRPLRQVLAQHLSARTILPVAGFVEAAVERIVTTAQTHGGLEAVADLAFPLPVMVMANLFGLPANDPAPLRPLFEAITRGHDMGASEWDRQQARLAQAALMRWLGPQLRMARPTPLLEAIHAIPEAQGSGPGPADYWCMMLLYAGSATTRDLIANAIGLLLEHPDAARRLADDPAVLEPAIEEILRFDGPVRGIGRVATECLTLGDAHTVEAGDLFYLMIADANRDPDYFAEPDRLDLTRTPNPHLAFATGVTHCLGAQLARLECRIVLERLRPLLPNLTAQEPANWSAVRLLRQRNTLYLSF
jgi:cytochrome P450